MRIARLNADIPLMSRNSGKLTATCCGANRWNDRRRNGAKCFWKRLMLSSSCPREKMESSDDDPRVTTSDSRSSMLSGSGKKHLAGLRWEKDKHKLWEWGKIGTRTLANSSSPLTSPCTVTSTRTWAFRARATKVRTFSSGVAFSPLMAQRIVVQRAAVLIAISRQRWQTADTASGE